MERHIYLKALKLFGNQGMRFTTEDLAKELGTSKRTIYAHCSSKKDLIEKTIDFVFTEIGTIDIEIIQKSNLSIQEKIELCLREIPDAYCIGSIIRHMDELQRLYPDLWEKVDRNLQMIWDPFIEMVKSGISNGELEAIDISILRLILDETLRKLLDYEFLATNQVSFEAGLKTMNHIILYGLIKRKDC